MKKIDFRSPYVCMSIVLVMYIIKVTLKLIIGSDINSISLYGDGLHNLSDIFEAVLVMFALYISKRPENSRYPLGKSSIENIGSLFIGVALLFISIDFFLKSILGIFLYVGIFPVVTSLLSNFVSIPEAIDFGTNALVVILVVVFSIFASWLVSWYQITTGKQKNHVSLIADGKETLSDSFVEMTVLIGLIGSFFGFKYLDYIFGLIVAGLMFRTSKGILKDAIGNLLQVSIDEEKFNEIKKLFAETKGIEDYEKGDDDRLMAFKLGKFIFVSAKVYVSPTLTPEGLYAIRKGLSQKVREILKDSEARVYIKEKVFQEKQGRVIIPVEETSNDLFRSFISEDFFKATSYYLVDVSGERIVTVRKYENNFKTRENLADFISRKMVDTVYLVKDDKKLEWLLPNVKFEKTNFIIFQDMFH
ncbi:MAG: cation diffusion facilitator family transporter [archaeon]